jgi:hypothetical protein
MENIMSEEVKRELFEKWLIGTGKILKEPFKLNGAGNYAVRATQLRYEGFAGALGIIQS